MRAARKKNGGRWYDNITDWLLVAFNGLWSRYRRVVYFGQKMRGMLPRIPPTSLGKPWLLPIVLGSPSPSRFGVNLRKMDFLSKFSFEIENVGKEPALGFKWFFKPKLIDYIGTGQGVVEYAEPNQARDSLQTTSANAGTVVWPSVDTKMWIPWDFADTPENRTIFSGTFTRAGSLIIDGCAIYVTAGEIHKTWVRFFLRDVPGPSSGWKFNLMPSGSGAN